MNLNINEKRNANNSVFENHAANNIDNEINDTANEINDPDDTITLSSSNTDDSDVIFLNSFNENIECHFDNNGNEREISH